MQDSRRNLKTTAGESFLPDNGEPFTSLCQPPALLEPEAFRTPRLKSQRTHFTRRCFLIASIARFAASAQPDVPPMPGEHTASPTLNTFRIEVSRGML